MTWICPECGSESIHILDGDCDYYWCKCANCDLEGDSESFEKEGVK